MGDSTQKTWERYPAALPEGFVLAGQYIIQDVLGQGGFGITYLAEDYQRKEKVAIKEFFPESMIMRQGGTPQITVYSGGKLENFRYGLRCFLDEARVLAQFQGNPNIVGVRSYFEENHTAYFVMDYMEGTDLKTYIQRHGGKLEWEETRDIMMSVMDALVEVHRRGIIHRDVTPDNILIARDHTVKLLDFGAARYNLGDRSQSLDVVLKAGYAPKEQYTRRGNQGPYTDVYSLAACFYTALCGYLPPESLDRMDKDELVPLSARGVQLPKSAEKAIMKGLEVQPEKRFQSMDEFKNAIRNGKADDMGKLKNFLKKYRLALSGAAAAVVLAVIAAYGNGKGTGEQKPAESSYTAEEEIEEDTVQSDRADGTVSYANYTEEEEAVPEQEKNTAEQDLEEEKQCADLLKARFDVWCKNETESYVAMGLGTAQEASEERERLVDICTDGLLSDYANDAFAEETELVKECFREMLLQAQYTVKGAEKQDDGSYVVTVAYTQMHFFEPVKELYADLITSLIDYWDDDMETILSSDQFENAMLVMLGKSMEKVLENVKYTELDEQLIRVEKSEDGFVIEEDGFDSMAELLFCLFDFENSENLGVYSYENGNSFIGIWEAEGSDGNGLFIFSDGDQYIGAIADGYPYGKGYYCWADDGSWYLGEFKDGQKNGSGTFCYTDQYIYMGDWEDNKRNGQGSCVYENGDYEIGTWEDDEFIG